MKYCESIYKTKRWPTREVMVGNVGVGGNNPVRIQSMTTSSTRDVEATIDQIMRLKDAGCEIARVTVQGMKEADACEEIKNGLVKKGYDIPLVADIHFFPPAAMRVVDFVDKVRVNPGNYVDKRAQFKVIEYDDASYAAEIERLEEKFTPLVEKCKRLKRSMRIGTNHGSLSDRIMNRYGDTPQGMVESALEFTRVCRKNDYHEIIFSMKASNPQVMIQAYRLLVAEMYKLGWNYPLHLGVTEAGNGEDGRIKSAMGIGALLLDGIGDTIRVSLTEDAWYEIDPCQRLIKMSEDYIGKGVEPFDEKFRKIDAIQRRPITWPKNVSMHKQGTVFVKASPQDAQKPDFYQKIGCDQQLGQPKIKIATADALVVSEASPLFDKLAHAGIGIIDGVLTLSEATKRRFQIAPSTPLLIKIETQDNWALLQELKPAAILLAPHQASSQSRLHFARKFFEWLQEKNLQIPVILNFTYNLSLEDLIIHAGAECGALLADGLGEGLYLEGPHPIETLRTLSFNILQAARMRTSKTDFISCPSCGRTLFDLQDVTKRIQTRTSHLPGVKIAIMGCIVNGPGEMADADFGYVGSKPGKIDLYVGKTVVEKDIEMAQADDRLVELIKSHGRWVEPEIAAT